MTDFIRKRGTELYREKVFELPVERAESLTNTPELLSRYVIENIEGVEDEELGEVNYAPELGEHILTLTVPLPEDYLEDAGGEEEFYAPAGTQLGVFYRRWVTTQSQAVQSFREDALTNAGKLSAVSSDTH
jgi:hypothetical protein